MICSTSLASTSLPTLAYCCDEAARASARVMRSLVPVLIWEAWSRRDTLALPHVGQVTSLRSSWRSKSSFEANQPSKRWLFSHPKLKTITSASGFSSLVSHQPYLTVVSVPGSHARLNHATKQLTTKYWVGW